MHKMILLIALITTACSNQVSAEEHPASDQLLIRAVMPLLDVFEKTTPTLMVFVPGPNGQKAGCTTKDSAPTADGQLFGCMIPLDALNDDDSASINIFVDEYISIGETRVIGDIKNSDPAYSTEVLHARALDGDDWSCLQQGVVNGQPTETKMSLDGTVTVTYDETARDFELYLHMWEERVRFLGDTISGEKDIVTYKGQSDSTKAFHFLRAANDDPQTGFQFVCTR